MLVMSSAGICVRMPWPLAILVFVAGV